MSGIIQPLTIYGPHGIREFVETALRISGSWTDYPLEIVEISTGEIFDDDLTLLSETLEEVLRSSGDPADQKYVELKARAEKALDDVKKRVSQASDSYYYRAKQAVYRADDYVHEKPWQGIGVGAAVGLVLGLLLARR